MQQGTPTNIDEFIQNKLNVQNNIVKGLLGRDISKLDKNLRVLDAGCAIGNLLLYAIDRGYDSNLLYGIDIEFRLIETAKKLVKGNFTIGNIENIPFKDNSFDCIFNYDVLEHVAEPNKVINEFNRVIQNNGFLYIRVADGYSFNDILFRIGGRILRGRSSHIQKLSKKDIIYLLESNKFIIIEDFPVKECLLSYLPICAKIPIIGKLLLKIGSILDPYMSVAYEFKCIKR